MITFYFRGMPWDGKAYQRTYDSLCSWNGSVDDVKKHFGEFGRNESIHIIAEFDDTSTPPVLLYRSARYTFKNMLGFRDDFPAFFIDQRDGSIWESEQMDGWGKVGKAPMIPGPEYTGEFEKHATKFQPVIPILYKRCP